METSGHHDIINGSKPLKNVRKNANPDPQTAASPGDPHVHLIPSAHPSHSGTYSCVAQNVLGQVNHDDDDHDRDRDDDDYDRDDNDYDCDDDI